MIVSQSMLQVFRGGLKRSLSLVVFPLSLQGAAEREISLAGVGGINSFLTAWLEEI
jgi:hypothetical protein